mmetsp:Transcript_3170/g.9139  ORF Transcript_3170/g.9139 Transcript_3170/m.9139 type:complete len:205 (+) Transcript_3170:193-807(+)
MIMFATTHCFTLADVQADGERLAVAEGATVGAAPLRVRGAGTPVAQRVPACCEGGVDGFRQTDAAQPAGRGFLAGGRGFCQLLPELCSTGGKCVPLSAQLQRLGQQPLGVCASWQPRCHQHVRHRRGRFRRRHTASTDAGDDAAIACCVRAGRAPPGGAVTGTVGGAFRNVSTGSMRRVFCGEQGVTAAGRSERCEPWIPDCCR